MENSRFKIDSLGNATIENPISKLTSPPLYVKDKDRLLFEPMISEFEKYSSTLSTPDTFELAGPREKIYFSPSRTKAAVVSCGGLCPGINGVIRAIVMELHHRYGCQNVVGVKFGYQGLGVNATSGFLDLTPDLVRNINEDGGTILGSSRGTPPPAEIVDILEKYNINILFAIGGDGTVRGAHDIAGEVKKRNLKISIINIPKTIDNDIPFVYESFGFESSVELAVQAVNTATIEAEGAQNGVGLVKLMGRNAGFITATACLSNGHVNFCLIPEVPFYLKGKSGLFSLLEERLAKRHHAVIVVAEGAGQYYFADHQNAKDASGNTKFDCIGTFLREKITAHFKEKNIPISLKYIDPSYIIRATAPNPKDKLLCARFGQAAVHAAMAGKTDLLIGLWGGRLTHVPLCEVVNNKKTLNPKGSLWFNLMETTGQPAVIGEPIKN